MGLAIGSGEYAYAINEDPEDAEWIEEDLSIINAALKDNGIEVHSEPKVLPEVSMSCIESFPYSFLHYLRRIYALNELGKEVTPTSGELTEIDDSIIEEATEMMSSHLLCHSDAEGYYVPIEFDDVIFNDELLGGILGSSQKLYKEIIKIAGLINIDVNDGAISEETNNLLAEADENHPYYIERVVWFTLYQHVKNSIENKTIISFS